MWMEVYQIWLNNVQYYTIKMNTSLMVTCSGISIKYLYYWNELHRCVITITKNILFTILCVLIHVIIYAENDTSFTILCGQNYAIVMERKNVQYFDFTIKKK
eukprot:118990_1